MPFVGDHEEGMTFETAAGLAADAARRGRSSLLLVEDLANSGYVRWLAGFRALVHPREEGPLDTWEAVARLRQRGLVRGYILFRHDRNDRPWHGLGPIDESANVATALAPLLGAVAVSERFQSRAGALGLPMLLDARERTEAWCLGTYGGGFSTKLVMTADPKSRVARSMAVASRAFVVSRPGPSPEYERSAAPARSCAARFDGAQPGGTSGQSSSSGGGPSARDGFRTRTCPCVGPTLQAGMIGGEDPRSALPAGPQRRRGRDGGGGLPRRGRGFRRRGVGHDPACSARPAGRPFVGGRSCALRTRRHPEHHLPRTRSPSGLRFEGEEVLPGAWWRTGEGVSRALAPGALRQWRDGPTLLEALCADSYELLLGQAVLSG